MWMFLMLLCLVMGNSDLISDEQHGTGQAEIALGFFALSSVLLCASPPIFLACAALIASGYGIIIFILIIWGGVILAMVM